LVSALRTGWAILGRNVLVTGETGSMGQFAVQLAAASGARVTAQVNRPEGRNDARQPGMVRCFGWCRQPW
jgi:NADPH:quinone reductase